MFLRVSAVISLLIPATIAVADDYRSKANAGYDFYKSGEYDKAVENYRQAGIVEPEKALPNLGKGSAEYRMNEFSEAGREFSLAADKASGKTKADALYNIGNSLYRAGNYQEALKSYVEALKIDPGDRDYKHNLELTLLKQQQQQQQSEGEDQEQQDRKQQGESQQDQGQRDQQSDQKQQDSQQREEEKRERSQRQSADEPQMSEEEARNLLARFEQDDKEVQEKLRQYNIGRSGGRDW